MNTLRQEKQHQCNINCSRAARYTINMLDCIATKIMEHQVLVRNNVWQGVAQFKAMGRAIDRLIVSQYSSLCSSLLSWLQSSTLYVTRRQFIIRVGWLCGLTLQLRERAELVFSYHLGCMPSTIWRLRALGLGALSHTSLAKVFLWFIGTLENMASSTQYGVLSTNVNCKYTSTALISQEN